LFWFAVLLICMGLIAYSALHACGINWVGGTLANCPRMQAASILRDDRLAGERADSERLASELAELRMRLATARRCSDPSSRRAAVAPPSQSGIPNAAWDSQDLKHLSGCWRLSSDYRLRDINTEVVRPVTTWTMCFDEHGNGSHQMEIGAETTCSANVKAEFKGENRLEISDEKDITCVNGLIIFKRQIACERATNGGVHCESSQAQTQGHSRVTFERKSG
jgi:hypothetical protein